jgi:ketosteroid isomerase-like protein
MKPSGFDVKTEMNEVSVRHYGKFGVVIAKIDYEMNIGGKTLPPRSIRATFVVRKEQGVWKVATANFTGIRPQTPQPSK